MGKRENGSGTIIRRKHVNSVKYTAYGPAKYIEDENGNIKLTRARVGTYLSRKETREALEQYIKHPTSTSKYNYTLRDVYEDWKRSAFADLKASTQTNWTTSWTKICDCKDPAIANTLMREITTSSIRGILDYYAAERKDIDKEGKEITIPALSKSYITKIKALLTQLCDYAIENNIIDRNYASLVRIPKMEVGKIRAFSDLEFAKLEKGWANASGGDACLVLCYTGFRVSEFCQLTRFAYDAKAKTLCGGLKTEAGKIVLCRSIRKYSQSLSGDTKPAKALSIPGPMESHTIRILSQTASGGLICVRWGYLMISHRTPPATH